MGYVDENVKDKSKEWQAFKKERGIKFAEKEGMLSKEDIRQQDVRKWLCSNCGKQIIQQKVFLRCSEKVYCIECIKLYRKEDKYG